MMRLRITPQPLRGQSTNRPPDTRQPLFSQQNLPELMKLIFSTVFCR